MTFFPIIFYLVSSTDAKPDFRFTDVDKLIDYIRKHKVKLQDYSIVLKRNKIEVGKITIKEYFRINEVVEFQKNN